MVASTSHLVAEGAAAQPSAEAPSTTHPPADLLAPPLTTSSTPPAQAASPAPQLPVPVNKKQYKAEPAPSFPSPADRADGLEPAAASVVGAYLGSGAEKQVELSFQSSTSPAVISVTNDQKLIMKQYSVCVCSKKPQPSQGYQGYLCVRRLALSGNALTEVRAVQEEPVFPVGKFQAAIQCLS